MCCGTKGSPRRHGSRGGFCHCEEQSDEAIPIQREHVGGRLLRFARNDSNFGRAVVTPSAISVPPWSILLPLDPMRGEAGAGRGEAFRAADMIPLAVMHDRVQPAGLFGPC